jgi:uncharacterized lipoprotein YmbA
MLAACTSSTPPALYTIAPVSAPPRSGTPKVIMLQQVVLARYLDRQQIVRSSENYRLDVMTNDWWGEPLSAMVSRVLVEELGERLPASTVLSENAGISSSPDATVELNIQRMDKDASGNLILQAQTGVAFKGKGAPALRSFRTSVTPPSSDIAGEVAAISTAVGQLADVITNMLLAAPRAR